MNLSLFGVKWPVTTSMIFLAIIVMGGFAWTQVGIDLMPDFEIPAITIITSYSGAGPQEVESRITEPIEESVSTVQNVDEVTSTSFEGVSVVTVKFNWGIELAEANNDVRDKLDLVSKRMPDKAEKPMIFKFNTSMIPVVILGMTAEESWEKLDRIVDKKIIEQLTRIPGVATALAWSGDQRGILVQLNRERVQSTGQTGKQIVNTLSTQNLDNPGGHLRSGAFKYLIRTPEEFKTIDDIGNVVVAKSPGIVRLRDLAEIKDGFLEKVGDFVMNGKRAIGVIVQKQSGANTVAVSKAVIDALPAIQAQLPTDLKISMFFDTSEFIRNTIRNLTDSVLIGGVVVFLVIFLPIIFTGGITQIIFGQLATIVVMALMASQFSALMLTPMMCAFLLKPVRPDAPAPDLWYLERMESAYARFLGWALDHRFIVVGTLVGMLVLSLGLMRMIGTEFIPEQDQGRMVIRYELTTGTRHEITDRVGNEIAAIVREKVPELLAVTVRSGKSSDAIYAAISGSKEGSHFSESRDPTEVVQFLNANFEGLTEIILRHDGVVDKFLGDGLMAFFNAPLEKESFVHDAVSAAYEMRQFVESEAIRKAAGSFDLKVGIALNVGYTVVGNIGSERKTEFTAIGDTVNTTSPMESLNKDFGTDIIASESVVDKTGNDFEWKFLAQQSILGKENAVKLYALVGKKAETPPSGVGGKK